MHFESLGITENLALLISGLKALSFAAALNIVSRLVKRWNYKLMINLAMITGIVANII
jgi:hypothetical protein